MVIASLAATILALSLRLPAPAVAQDASEPPTRAGRTVVLELFTSEGCSSCPPADRLLEELAGSAVGNDIEIVPLSLHVDYFNHLGWRDPYSKASFSRRQERYAEVLPAGRVYTPQLVVDGEVHLLGSERPQVMAAIATAGQRPDAAVLLRPSTASKAGAEGNTWQVSIDAAPVSPRPVSVRLFVAVTEDGLQSSVSRGENAGRRLEHVAVVRSLSALGEVPIGPTGSATHTVKIDLDSSWRRDRLHLVAWIADGPNGRILGAARRRP
jgi:hypothetical protein